MVVGGYLWSGVATHSHQWLLADGSSHWLKVVANGYLWSRVATHSHEWLLVDGSSHWLEVKYSMNELYLIGFKPIK